jgi:glycerophosphoryl diester phosphodiesterase
MWIVGHRGTRGIAPENTLKAINEGIKCADYVELDVRLSHDNAPVIIHDAWLDRTTSGTGHVNDLRLKDLRGLDAGDGEKIPTLEEVISVVLHRGKGIFIEIKEPGSEKIVSSVLSEFQKGKIICVSFHSESLEVMKSYLPDLKTGIIIPNNHKDQHFEEKRFLYDFILPRKDFLSHEFVRKAHDSGMQVIPWTLNIKAELKRAIPTGIDGVITDDPCNTLRIIKTFIS